MEDKKFHIIIADNETGETRLDMHTDLILAAIDDGEGTHCVQAAQANAIAIASALASLEDARHELTKAHPEIKQLLIMLGKHADTERRSLFSKLFKNKSK